jgi:hypothetical protein
MFPIAGGVKVLNSKVLDCEFKPAAIVPRGFEPLSQAPKAGMLDHYTTGLLSLLYDCASSVKKFHHHPILAYSSILSLSVFPS